MEELIWLAALFSLVIFGGLCGSFFLWWFHVQPLEKRLRKAEKCLAVNDRVYQIHYGVLSREQTLLDNRLIAMAREMPTKLPPAR